MVDIMKVHLAILLLLVWVLAVYCHDRPRAHPTHETKVSVDERSTTPNGSLPHQHRGIAASRKSGSVHRSPNWTLASSNDNGLKKFKQKMAKDSKLRNIYQARGEKYSTARLKSIKTRIRSKRSTPLDEWQNFLRTKEDTHTIDLTATVHDDTEVLPKTVRPSSALSHLTSRTTNSKITVDIPAETVHSTALADTGTENVERSHVGDIDETTNVIFFTETSLAGMASTSSRSNSGNWKFEERTSDSVTFSATPGSGILGDSGWWITGNVNFDRSRDTAEMTRETVFAKASVSEISGDSSQRIKAKNAEGDKTTRGTVFAKVSVSEISDDSSQRIKAKNADGDKTTRGTIFAKVSVHEISGVSGQQIKAKNVESMSAEKTTLGADGTLKGKLNRDFSESTLKTSLTVTSGTRRWTPRNHEHVNRRPSILAEATGETTFAEMPVSGISKISSWWNTKSGRVVPDLTTPTVVTGAPVSEIVLDNSSQRSVPNSLLDFSETKLNETTNSTTDANLTEADLIFIEDIYKGVIRMRTYATPITAGVGVTGNVLSLFVMTRKHNRENSTCFLMAVLSVVDLLANIALLPFQWIPTVIAPHLMTNTYCSISFYIISTLSASSIVVLTYMTAQRVTCVYRPLEAKAILSNIKRTRRTVFGLLLFVAVWVLPITFSMARKEPNGHNWDIMFCESKYRHGTLFKIYMAAETVLFSLVPFGIILGSNIAILVKMNAAAKKRARLQQTRTEMNASSRTTMLLLISFAFLILVAPIRVIYLVSMCVRRRATTAVTEAKLDLAIVIGYQFILLNNVVNFYLYILGGGKKFKSDLTSICTCGQKH
jgi:hypothetical protein